MTFEIANLLEIQEEEELTAEEHLKERDESRKNRELAVEEIIQGERVENLLQLMRIVIVSPKGIFHILKLLTKFIMWC